MNSFLDVTNPRVIDLKTRSVLPGASCRGIRRTLYSPLLLQHHSNCYWHTYMFNIVL